MTSTSSYSCTLHGTHLPTRIDRALVAAFPALSRRRIRRLLDYGSIYLNRRRVRIAARLAFSGDTVEIFLPSSTSLSSPPALHNTDIIYCDTNLLVINKPPGLLSQATRDQAIVHLVVAVRNLLPQCGTLHVVHRLDQETSGAIMLARHRRSADFLSQQLRQRRVGKEYLALCAGIPVWQQHTVRTHLTAIDKHLGTVAIAAHRHPHTRTATTRFTRLATSPSHSISLLRCEPLSGRSHQIRIQLQQLNLPLLGDKKYGNTRPQLPVAMAALTDTHHLLHAYRLNLQPTANSERITVQAPLPPNFSQLLHLLEMAAAVA